MKTEVKIAQDFILRTRVQPGLETPFMSLLDVIEGVPTAADKIKFDTKRVNIPSVKFRNPLCCDYEGEYTDLMVEKFRKAAILDKEIKAEDNPTYSFSKNIMVDILVDKELSGITLSEFENRASIYKDANVIIYNNSQYGEPMQLLEAITRYGDRKVFAFIALDYTYINTATAAAIILK